MLLRSIAAFLALPGVVAYLVPYVLVGAQRSLPSNGGIALPVLAVGTLGLFWCVVSFYREGRGTLAPWSPPTHLVTSGLYRYSRNPMYLSVLLILVGWSLAFWSTVLLAYMAAVAVGFHLRVILAEEPWLAAQHGTQWLAYAGQVNRWFGRSSPPPSTAA